MIINSDQTSNSAPIPVPTRQIALDLYRRSMLIHLTDERFRTMLRAGEIRLVYYPVRGQEVLSASVMAATRNDDYLVTTYRGLHDHIAKGVPLRELWAEFLGRSTGSCKGKGGPMHITVPDRGVMVTTGVVGSGLPIANGLALSAMLRGSDQVTVCSFGDGAANIGAFHEALNMASLWNLPVLFLCQNNRYAEHTPYSGGTSAARIIDRALGYSMACERVDGTDAFATYEAARAAVARARSHQGPTLIEAMCYRMLGHTNGSNPRAYVPEAFFAEAEANDPILALRRRLLDLAIPAGDLDAINAQILEEIDDAVQFALASPYPDPSETYMDIFAGSVSG